MKLFVDCVCVLRVKIGYESSASTAYEKFRLEGGRMDTFYRITAGEGEDFYAVFNARISEAKAKLAIII